MTPKGRNFTYLEDPGMIAWNLWMSPVLWADPASKRRPPSKQNKGHKWVPGGYQDISYVLFLFILLFAEVSFDVFTFLTPKKGVSCHRLGLILRREMGILIQTKITRELKNKNLSIEGLRNHPWKLTFWSPKLVVVCRCFSLSKEEKLVSVSMLKFGGGCFFRRPQTTTNPSFHPNDQIICSEQPKKKHPFPYYCWWRKNPASTSWGW